MSRFDDLEVFAKVVVVGSMSAAAREMGLSPAVISKRMQRLEERLDLVDRAEVGPDSARETSGGHHDRIVGAPLRFDPSNDPVDRLDRLIEDSALNARLRSSSDHPIIRS